VRDARADRLARQLGAVQEEQQADGEGGEAVEETGRQALAGSSVASTTVATSISVKSSGTKAGRFMEAISPRLRSKEKSIHSMDL
jgi:hypothetical protein